MAVLTGLSLCAEPQAGSLYVAPMPEKPLLTNAPGLFCETAELPFEGR